MFGKVVVQTAGVIVDNVLVGINEHEPGAIALFEGAHALEIKIVLSHSMQHEIGIVAKIFRFGFNVGGHELGIVPDKDVHEFAIGIALENGTGRRFGIGINGHNQIAEGHDVIMIGQPFDQPVIVI